MKEEGNGDEKRKRVGGEGDGAVPKQTECPQTKTHGARAMPMLPRWLPAEVVLYGTNPETAVLSSATGDAQKPLFLSYCANEARRYEKAR